MAPEQSITPQTGRRMDRMIIVVTGLGAWLFCLRQVRARAQARSRSWSASAVPNESKFVINAKSIAVLPFENLSDDKENAFFTDGVQDEILTNLAKIADLKVISRTSVMQYKSGVAAQSARDRRSSSAWRMSSKAVCSARPTKCG